MLAFFDKRLALFCLISKNLASLKELLFRNFKLHHMNLDEVLPFGNEPQPIPFYKLLGMEIVRASEGKSRLRLPFKKELTIPRGVMHGGAIASIADSSVAIALFTLIDPEKDVATINLEVNYLAPAEGEIMADAEIIHKGSKIAVGEVEVKDEENNTVAKATATYVIL